MLPDGRVVLRRAELAARGKCWIDGECAQAQPHGGGGAGWPRAWLSQDDVEDAYRRLRVRCNTRALLCKEGAPPSLVGNPPAFAPSFPRPDRSPLRQVGQDQAACLARARDYHAQVRTRARMALPVLRPPACVWGGCVV